MLKVNTVHQGDCLEVMRQLPDNCIDTIITDPPYDLTNRTPDVKRCVDCKRVLGGQDGNPSRCPRCGGVLSRQRSKQSRGFMGKEWDGSGIAFNPEVWRECLRVTKPGATLMAFGGTRTYHRMTCAIEDAGWQIRDCISYFHDASHQELAFMASLDEEQLAAYMELHYPGWGMSWMYGSGFPKSADISKMLDKQEGAEREVIGIKTRVDGTQRPNMENWNIDGSVIYGNGNGLRADKKSLVNSNALSAPATPLAKKWDGWKSHGLKPAYEPIVVAVKPNEGSYADNARKWGVSGLNIDGGRIETGDDLQRPERNGLGNTGGWANYSQPKGTYGTPKGLGRYPANVIHDNSETVEAVFAKAGVRTSGARTPTRKPKFGTNGIYNKSNTLDNSKCEASTGSASRYFAKCPADRFYYHPKAPASERATPGNNHPTQKPLSLIRELARLTKTPDGGIVLDPFAGSGTTALACIAEGREYILIEKEPEYCEIIRRRIAEYNGETIEEKEIELSNNEVVKQMALW